MDIKFKKNAFLTLHLKKIKMKQV